MGRATGQSKNLKGKIGSMIYLQRKDGTTVVYEAKERKETPTRSEDQMRVRTQWSNLGAVYTQFHKTLKKGFEGLENGLSDYNAFIQANVGVCKVYIPKWIRLNGGCVLAPYLVTRGKLASVSMTRNAGDVLVSNIALGALEIGEETTVGELSAAMLAYNATWQEGDQLTFFYGTQSIDEVSGTPRALIQGWKVVLDVTDETLLWNEVSPIGFSTVDGYLSMATPISDAAAVWIHTRELSSGSGLQVSTQYLYVDSAILDSYQNDAAFAASAQSYGGINTEDAFLDPRSSGCSRVSGSTVQVPSVNGGASGGAGNTGGNSGGSSQGETNGGSSANTGGGTGNVTPSVPKLTINSTGNGTSSVTANGNAVTSGVEVAAGTEVSISVTPAEGATPTVSLNGSSVALTESDGVYSGTFQMPSNNATLNINSGGATGGADIN